MEQTEKTIKYLNSKWWYRLLKLIYISVFLIITIVGLFLIDGQYSPKKIFDNKSSYIQCVGKDIKYYLDENDIYLFDGYIGFSDDDKFTSWCNIGGRDLLNKETSINYLASKKNYNLVSVYETVGSNYDVLKYSIEFLIIIYIIFEIIKRAFYYVSLGKINPPSYNSHKTNNN